VTSAPVKFVVIYCHANAVDLGGMANQGLMHAREWEAHVLVPEYPGYGVAPGFPTEATVNDAVLSVAMMAMNLLKVDHTRILVFGRSIGTGIATALTRWMSDRNMPPAALIVQSPYKSIRDIACEVVGNVGAVIHQRWNTEENLEHVKAPVLILHGDRDEVIPIAHGEALFSNRENYQVSCEMHVQPGATHNEYDLFRDVLAPGADFIHRHVVDGSVHCDLKLLDQFTVVPELTPRPKKNPCRYVGYCCCVSLEVSFGACALLCRKLCGSAKHRHHTAKTSMAVAAHPALQPLVEPEVEPPKLQPHRNAPVTQGTHAPQPHRQAQPAHVQVNRATPQQFVPQHVVRQPQQNAAQVHHGQQFR
jgi:esterase/lipase